MQAPGSRDEADPGNEIVNQRRNKQNHDRDSSPRQTDRGCRCERWRGSGWGWPPGAVTQPTGGPGWTVHAEVSAKALSKFGKLSSGHRTGKSQFSFQSQRKAMPKNAQTIAQLHSSHMQAGSGRSPGVGNGNPLQYSCLENPTDRGAWRATVHGVTKSQTWDFPGKSTGVGCHCLLLLACEMSAIVR